MAMIPGQIDLQAPRGMVNSATLSRGERLATNFDAEFIAGRVTLARSDSFSIIRMIVRPASPT